MTQPSNEKVVGIEELINSQNGFAKSVGTAISKAGNERIIIDFSKFKFAFDCNKLDDLTQYYADKSQIQPTADGKAPKGFVIHNQVDNIHQPVCLNTVDGTPSTVLVINPMSIDEEGRKDFKELVTLHIKKFAENIQKATGVDEALSAIDNFKKALGDAYKEFGKGVDAYPSDTDYVKNNLVSIDGVTYSKLPKNENFEAFLVEKETTIIANRGAEVKVNKGDYVLLDKVTGEVRKVDAEMFERTYNVIPHKPVQEQREKQILGDSELTAISKEKIDAVVEKYLNLMLEREVEYKYKTTPKRKNVTSL